jgi:hypothetical protein
MKKILLLILGVGLLLSSCFEDESIVDLGNPPPPNVLSSEAPMGSTVVLQQSDAGETFSVLSWTAADFGGRPVNYSIELDRAGNNFAAAKDVITIKGLKDTLTVQDINAALIQYGIAAGETADVEVRVRSWADYISAPARSNAVQFTLTPYELVFPPIYINGDAQGWNWANAVQLTSTTPGIYTGKAKFQTNGKFRFFRIPDWNIPGNELGWSNFPVASLPAEFVTGADGDNNMQFTGLTADYLITVDLENNTIAINLAGPAPAPSALFLVTAQTFDLANAIELKSIDSAIYQGVVMLESNTKFRIFADREWNAAKWGWSSFEETDELLAASGDDVSSILFTGTSGYYVVNLSLIDRSITLEPTEAPSEMLFLIGDPQGWALDPSLAMRSLGGNMFEVIAEFNTGDIFRFFKELDWSADQYRWSSFAGGTIDSDLSDGGGGDSNFRFSGTSGVYKMTVSISDKTITVEPVAQPTLHIIGDDQSWTPASAVSMTWLGGGMYQATTTFTNNSIFRFFANNDPGDWDWSGEQWRYSSFENGSIDSGNLADGGGGDSNFRFIGTTGTHTLTVNINSLTIDID